ncbi:MAG: helix-turn-helix transcriptional regulator [Sneathiella sp.]|nr:helix-turn-helix transcriptional regulator [Sneathiella sp.]
MSYHPVDVYVGSRIKHQRTVSGISQEKLGRELGLTFQQVQKYEKGANRVGASRLYQISQILNVPPSFFFEGMSEDATDAHGGLYDESAGFEHDSLSKRETLELVRAYYKIDDTELRKRVFDLIKSLGGIDLDIENS